MCARGCRALLLFAGIVALVLSASEPAGAQRSLGTVVVEMHYGTPATVLLPIANNCLTTERVEIFLFGLYFIEEVPAFEIVDGKSTKTVSASANPPPLPPFTLGPGQTAESIDLTRIEKGFLAYEYGGRPEPPCAPTYEGWDIVVKLTPPPADAKPPVPPPPPPPDPVVLMTTNPCTTWWLTGAASKTPDGRDLTAECLEPMRRLATDYRERVLGPLASTAPDLWAWLPESVAIAQMTIPELLAMKARAAQLVEAAAQQGRRP